MIREMITDAQAIYQAAVRAVQPDRLVQGCTLESLVPRAWDAYRRVVIVGTGKASMAMAGAMEARLGDRIDAGLVVVPHGYRTAWPDSLPAPQSSTVVEAGHPVPDEAGVVAADRVLEMAAACEEDDLLLALISGGGSSLWSSFQPGIALDEAQHVFRLLLRSGADIHQINTVRKHLTRIGGGWLVARAFPASVLALVISDVIGDEHSVIASGPTVPDPTTYEDAIAVLHAFDLWARVPVSIRDYLEQGRRGERAETPDANASCFSAVTTYLLGSNRDALAAAQDEAQRLGYTVRVVARDLQGEARDVGQDIARQALNTPADHPTCLLWGGETTVTVTGEGRGGRNQEVALGAALVLDGRERDVVILSGGTDGIDGPTDAAGAWATPQTILEARQHGIDPRAALQHNDAYPFFEKIHALLKPGPTHTNVMDLQIALI